MSRTTNPAEAFTFRFQETESGSERRSGRSSASSSRRSAQRPSRLSRRERSSFGQRSASKPHRRSQRRHKRSGRMPACCPIICLTLTISGEAAASHASTRGAPIRTRSSSTYCRRTLLHLIASFDVRPSISTHPFCGSPHKRRSSRGRRSTRARLGTSRKQQ